MIAILSDIHGNLEALQAVLDDARQLNAKSIYCLGDLVGYGPDPCDCLRMAMRWDRVICGDFDNALVRGVSSNDSIGILYPTCERNPICSPFLRSMIYW